MNKCEPRDELQMLKDKFRHDTVFQQIHERFIKLNSEQQKKNTEHVLTVSFYLLVSLKN